MPVFFEHTTSFVDANSRLFDFLWTSAAALWNLRWQVDGLSRSLGGYDETHAKSRFVSGSNIRGANLKQICVDDSWDENQDRLAEVALTLGIANFESWLAHTVSMFHVGTGNAKKDRAARIAIAGDLQKPTEFAAALASLRGPASTVLSKCVAPLLTKEHDKAIHALPQLITVYRHFKDLRNKIAHEGGIADAQLVQSHADMSSLTPADLSMKEVPTTTPVVLGGRVSLVLRGVVGVTGVIVRMVKAMDAQLAGSKRAEADLLRRWEKQWGKHVGAYVLTASRRHEKIARRCRHIGLPTPLHLTDLDGLLQTHHLVME